MDNKKLGIILLIAGIVLISLLYAIKAREDAIVDEFVDEEGTCYLDDGTCLHSDRGILVYIIGMILGGAIVALSVYILFFERSQKEILSTLENHKKIQVNEEKFDILLKGLDEFEKKVIKAVKDQDGITQQTLRLRTDMHKSKLSIVLDGLEKKELIKRIEKGKTKQVFLKIDV